MFMFWIVLFNWRIASGSCKASSCSSGVHLANPYIKLYQFKIPLKVKDISSRAEWALSNNQIKIKMISAWRMRSTFGIKDFPSIFVKLKLIFRIDSRSWHEVQIHSSFHQIMKETYRIQEHIRDFAWRIPWSPSVKYER